MIGVEVKIVPFFDGTWGRRVLLVRNGRDRDFFGGVVEEAEKTGPAIIRLMKSLGGIDLSEERLSSLQYQASELGGHRGIYWLAAELTAEEAKAVPKKNALGRVMTVSLLGVWGELQQIPDLGKGVPLSEYWSDTLLPRLNR